MQAHIYSQQTWAPKFLRLALTASERYTVWNSAPIPSSTRNRNCTRVGAMRCYAGGAILNYAMSHYEPLWVTISYYELLWATMSHYEPLWPKILTLRPTITQMSIEYNVTTQKKTKEVFHLSQFYPKNNFFGPIWLQNLKMLCFKWNLARVCIRRCWLRIW